MALKGWYAKEYADYVNIYAPQCAFYMRIYKKSTPLALEKARHIIDVLNTVGEYEKEISILQDAQQQVDKNSTKLQFEMAAKMDDLKQGNISLKDENDALMRDARRTESQFAYMRNVIENQSVALRNISSSLEK